MKPGSLPFIAGSGLIIIVAACQGPPPPIPQSPVQSSMYRHFALARDMRTFSVSGELDILRSTARELVETEESWGMPPGADAFVGRIHEAAGRVADAPDIVLAADAVAQVAAECGACHVANDVDLGSRFQTTAPLENGSVSRHMARLAWVSRLLWDGLIGPSDRTWATGAEALATAESFPGPVTQYVPQAETEGAAGRLRELGEQAAVTDNSGERAVLLARIWGVCADCHTQAGIH